MGVAPGPARREHGGFTRPSGLAIRPGRPTRLIPGTPARAADRGLAEGGCSDRPGLRRGAGLNRGTDGGGLVPDAATHQPGAAPPAVRQVRLLARTRTRPCNREAGTLEWTTLEWTTLEWTALEWTTLEWTTLEWTALLRELHVKHGSLHRLRLTCQLELDLTYQLPSPRGSRTGRAAPSCASRSRLGSPVSTGGAASTLNQQPEWSSRPRSEPDEARTSHYRPTRMLHVKPETWPGFRPHTKHARALPPTPSGTNQKDHGPTDKAELSAMARRGAARSRHPR